MATVRGTGALEDALAEARRRVEVSVQALDVLPSSVYRDALVLLGRHLAERAT